MREAIREIGTTGPFHQQVSRFTLNYWAVEGYLDLIVRDASFATVLPRSALLGAVGVALTAVGQVMMRRRLREVLR